MDGRCCDSRLNIGRIIRLCRPHQFYAPSFSIELHFAAEWKQLVTSILAGVCVAECPRQAYKISYHRFNRSGEIRPEAVAGGIFDSFFHVTFTPEVASDVIPV